MSNRFSRQRGLLRQNIVERLDVQFDREHVPAEFSAAMDLLGEHLGVERTRSNKIKYTISWNTGIDTSDEPNEISIGYGENGVFLDGSEIGCLLYTSPSPRDCQ